MALNAQQVASLNALNQKIAGGYQPNATDTANLNYAKNQGYTYNPVPQGATKISNPSGLQGLNESQLFRQGQDIYKLPTVSKTLTSDQVTGSIPDVQATEQKQSSTDIFMSGINASQEYKDLVAKQNEEKLAQTTKKTTLEQQYDDLVKGKTDKKISARNEVYQEAGLNDEQKSIAEKKSNLASLKAQYEQAIQSQEGRVGSASSIYGRQALIQKDYALKYGQAAAELSALTGNYQEAKKLADETLNLKYEDIENEISVTRDQLDRVYDELSASDKIRADQQKAILDVKEQEIKDNKEMESKINTVFYDALKGGASEAVLKRIGEAKTYQEALLIGKNYLTDNSEDDDSPEPIDVQYADLNDMPQEIVEGTPNWARVLISSTAEETGIPASLLSAVIKHETAGTFNPAIQSGYVKNGKRENSWGLGQINLDAHPDVTKAQATDAGFAIKFAANRLKSMIDKYGLYEGVQAYNTPGAIGSDQLIKYANDILGSVGIDPKGKSDTSNISDFDYARSIIEANPNATPEELKVGLLENTNLSATKINALIAEMKAKATTTTTEDVVEKTKKWWEFWK